jgi:hypothetical protein
MAEVDQFPILGQTLHHTDGQSQGTDHVQPQQADGVFKAGDLLGKAIVRGIGHFQGFGGQGRVIAYHLRNVPGAGSFAFHQTEYLG